VENRSLLDSHSGQLDGPVLATHGRRRVGSQGRARSVPYCLDASASNQGEGRPAIETPCLERPSLRSGLSEPRRAGGARRSGGRSAGAIGTLPGPRPKAHCRVRARSVMVTIERLGSDPPPPKDRT
jgi:hypothetical protein